MDVVDDLMLENLLSCPVCGADTSRLLFVQPDQHIRAGLRIVQCAACLVVYLNPRLTIDAATELEERSMFYDIDNDAAEQNIVALQGLIVVLEQHVPRKGILLDLGCNQGWLLEAAKRRGWEAIGVELSPTARRMAQDRYSLLVYHNMLNVPEGMLFELVTAWHVVEHTPDPVGFLRQGASRLKEGGVLALQVPSFALLHEFQRRSMISALVCAVHNFYFTEYSLSVIIARAGLKAKWMKSNDGDLSITALCQRTQIQQPR